MTQDVSITLKDGNDNDILLRAREFDDGTLAFYHVVENKLTDGINRSGSITTGSVSQQIAAANSARTGFSFQNTSDTIMYLSEDGEPATLASYQIPANGTAEINTYYAVNVLCTVAGKTFAATELQRIYTEMSESDITTQTGTTYTLVLTDANKVIQFTNAGSITLTIPTNATVQFPIGTLIELHQTGTGTVVVTAAGGVTLLSRASLVSLAGQEAVAAIRKVATNTWRLTGDIA